MQKRIMAINDLSCYGRCAMTVALPVLSAAGHECAVIPSALLSTHFAYPNPPSFAMTNEIRAITSHLHSINVVFDAISIGYLDNFEQIDCVMDFLRIFGKNNPCILADPTMADHGKMYGNPSYNDEFLEGMRRVVGCADITVPNITEAAFLCHMDFEKPPHNKKYIEKLLNGLLELGVKSAVVTGVIFDDQSIGSACLTHKNTDVYYTFSKQVEGRFIGTGDMYAAALLGALMNGFSIEKAIHIATEFVSFAIQKTLVQNTVDSMAINFEQSLPQYMRLLELI